MPQIKSAEELISEVEDKINPKNNTIKPATELVNEKEFLLNTPTKEAQCDVVWIFALPEERDIAFDALNIPNQNRTECIRDFITTYAFTFQRFNLGKSTIAAITQASMGMSSATSLATRAILAFRPKLVVMSGICAGRKNKVKIGDLIVADQTYDYTAGKNYVDKFAPRPLPLATDIILKDYIVSSIIGHSDIDRLARQPSSIWTPSRQIDIYLKSLASGTSVIDDDKTIEEASLIQDNLFGIDMEAYGIAVAASSLGTKWLVAKGVQDYADGNKGLTEEDGRSFAAYASALLVGKIITDIVPDLQ